MSDSLIDYLRGTRRYGSHEVGLFVRQARGELPIPTRAERLREARQILDGLRYGARFYPQEGLGEELSDSVTISWRTRDSEAPWCGRGLREGEGEPWGARPAEQGGEQAAQQLPARGPGTSHRILLQERDHVATALPADPVGASDGPGRAPPWRHTCLRALGASGDRPHPLKDELTPDFLLCLS
jgi:hypothetical protein